MPINSISFPANSLGGWLSAKARWAGPTSYTQITLGTAPAAPTGGDTIASIPNVFGTGSVDFMIGNVTTDGAFTVRPIITGNGTTATLVWYANKTATLGGQSQTAGTEAASSTDLHTYLVDLLALRHP